MLLRVDVLAEDMELARADTVSGCPIVAALKRITGLDWWVDCEDTYPVDLYSEATIRFPDPVINKLADWDEGLSLDPFSFDLILPEEVVELISVDDEVEE